jgi:hypothetical protein
VKHIIVDPILFEVGREVDQDISTKVEARSFDAKQRLVAALSGVCDEDIVADFARTSAMRVCLGLLHVCG